MEGSLGVEEVKGKEESEEEMRLSIRKKEGVEKERTEEEVGEGVEEKT